MTGVANELNCKHTHSLRKWSNGYCTHYARTNFIICAREVHKGATGVSTCHDSNQFFLVLICAFSCERLAFLSAVHITYKDVVDMDYNVVVFRWYAAVQ